MYTWVLVKPMSYSSSFSWRKIKKHKRFPWFMRWIMLLEWHLKENSMASTFATQFIWRLCFLHVYVIPCEAMFYGSAFSWRKVEKHKRFPWIMRWIMLLERHLTKNSMVSTSATQFIGRPCFPYAYVSLCEAHVLRLGIFEGPKLATRGGVNGRNQISTPKAILSKARSKT